MNFKIGQEFKINGQDMCLIDLLVYDNIQYALFSIDEKRIDYKFYAIIDTGKEYKLIEVLDETLFNNLLNMVEVKLDEEY